MHVYEHMQNCDERLIFDREKPVKIIQTVVAPLQWQTRHSSK